MVLNEQAMDAIVVQRGEITGDVLRTEHDAEETPFDTHTHEKGASRDQSGVNTGRGLLTPYIAYKHVTNQ